MADLRRLDKYDEGATNHAKASKKRGQNHEKKIFVGNLIFKVSPQFGIEILKCREEGESMMFGDVGSWWEKIKRSWTLFRTLSF